jgi:8-oxo-dGTP diphosphatase
MNGKNGLQDVNGIDWSSWIPTERAVLCFVRDNGRILLIHKKTGLGAGKVNAPGGRIEPGELPSHAAIRETAEEVRIAVRDLYETGHLYFEFTNGYRLHGTVFFSTAFTGTPSETFEATPFWCDETRIPYENMWEDDRHWLPLALAGNYIEGYFIFDDDRMLSKKVTMCPRQV